MTGAWRPPTSGPADEPPLPWPPPPSAWGPAGYPPYGYPLPHQQRGTNGFAVASLVLGLLWVFWIGSVLAIVFGFIALSQIRQRGEGGRGLAITGIVLGFLGGALLVLAVVAALVTTTSTTTNALVLL